MGLICTAATYIFVAFKISASFLVIVAAHLLHDYIATYLNFSRILTPQANLCIFSKQPSSNKRNKILTLIKKLFPLRVAQEVCSELHNYFFVLTCHATRPFTSCRIPLP